MQQWNDLNNMQLIFCWLQISVRLDWILTDQIQLCSSFNPQSPLIQEIDFASLLHFLSHFSDAHTPTLLQLEYLYIYTFQIIQSAQITWKTNHYNSRLRYKIKSFYWPTQHGKLCAKINSCVNRLSSVNTENSVKSFSHRVNSVSTEFPVRTEWARWKFTSPIFLRWPS